MATLDHAELETLWSENGGDARFADLAAAIAQAESSGCQFAHAGPKDDRPVKECTYRKTTGENSYGLWQINLDAHPQYHSPGIYDLQTNALAAIVISDNGKDFTPWSTFTNGAYEQYLKVQTAVPPEGTKPPTQAAPAPQEPQGGAQPQVQVQQAWNRLHQFLAWGVRDQRQRVNRSQSRIRKAVR